MIVLDRTSSVALSDQIERQLREMVANRALSGGAKLMSIRRLATQLAVSPNTVVVAYDRLVAAGVITSHGTSGFFVCSGADAVRAVADEVALEAGKNKKQFGYRSKPTMRGPISCWRVVAHYRQHGYKMPCQRSLYKKL